MRLSRIYTTLILFISFSYGMSVADAQTMVSGGTVSGTWSQSNSPYVIQGDILIPSDSTLSVEEGTIILFEAGFKFEVEGYLLASGTLVNPILISASDTSLPWAGLKFKGGLSSAGDSSLLSHCVISFARTVFPDSLGGGLFIDNYSHLRVGNCEIRNNRAGAKGGGICCLNGASPFFDDNLVTNNYARIGGGIFLDQSNPRFRGLILTDNLASDFGGGIAFSHAAYPVFDTAGMLIIYNNYATAAGTDLYAFDEPFLLRTMEIDSFTVAEPDLHFVQPFSQFALTIGHGKNPQFSQDLYVSPDGSDENQGLSFSEPLRTIVAALQRIKADSLHPRAIYLEQGEFSQQASQQHFPLNMRSFVSIKGDNSMMTYFIGTGDEYFCRFYGDKNAGMKDINLSGGFAGNGGAIRIEQGDSIILENLKFENNMASMAGGAIYCKGSDHMQLKNCEFSFQSATQGGALYCSNASGTQISGNTFFYNNALNLGGALSALSMSDMVITGSLFIGNSAEDAGACYFADHSSLETQNLAFVQNYASTGNGGAIAVQDASFLRLTKVLFQDNQAVLMGGAMLLTDSAVVQLQNSSLIGNAAGGGGAIAGSQHAGLRMINTLITNNSVNSGPSGTISGILLGDQINLEIINTTIANNTAGAAIRITGSQALIKNSILWNNAAGNVLDTLSNIQISFSDIGGGWTGNGNIDTDPLFNEPSLGDYSLTSLSPCINAADPDTNGLFLPLFDLNDNPRIAEGALDMGPLESFFPVISENVSGHVVFVNPLHPTPLPNCTVKLQQGTTVIATTLTDSAGYYLFADQAAGNYTLHVSSTNPWGGVNSIDAMLILRHFVGLSLLQGLLLKAGNVDGSASINAIDAQIIAKRFVGIISTFTIGDWVFDVPQLTVPQSGALDIIIHGACAGDVNASFIPSYQP